MATNKLRKRLEDADEKTLSRMTENFCMIGTPLPRLDGKRDANEYKPVWEQEVRDEQGRRRFHGAFTGGFSAGYYNSVGSREGWTPSTFRSSRKDKEKIAGESSSASRGSVEQRPEDFMDEEDLEALKEARGPLGSTQTYRMDDIQQQQVDRDPLMAMLGGFAPTQRQDDAVGSIQIAPTSLGTRLLQRMGWRPGQGLGPRVTFAKRMKMLAMLGMPLSAEEKSDEEASKHLWPPPDTPMPAFSTKNDSKGLGWVNESRGNGLGEALRRARAEGEKEKSQRKTNGFGLGALEVDSDGEDDVYASGARIEDSTLNKRPAMQWNNDSDRVMLGQVKAKHDAGTKAPPRIESDGDRNCWHDGRPMLPGFRIASSATLEEEPWFEAPEVPKGWTPDPRLIWNQAATKKEEYKSNMTSSERASILGEARLPGPPPSILNYLSQKDKERLEKSKKAAAAIKAGKTSSTETISASEARLDAQDIPKLDAEVARSALRGYMPFSSEPEKQVRYRKYLESQADPQGDQKGLLQSSLSHTKAQLISELREFAKSAGIFKPMSTVMASRFQSSNSSSSDVPQINPGLYVPERKAEISVEEKKAKAAQEKEEDAKRKLEQMESLTSLQRNARLGLFGESTTRETKVWKPSRLLCKRFNVPQPYPDEDDRSDTVNRGEGRDTSKEDLEAAFGSSKIQQMNLPKINARWEESKKQLQQLASMRANERREVEVEKGESQAPDASNEKQIGHSDISNIGLGEVKADVDDEADIVKPSIDIFKAVFADDDSDDESDEGGLVETKTSLTRVAETQDAGVRNEAPKGNGIVAEKDSNGPTQPVFVPRKRNAEEGLVRKHDAEEKKKKKKVRSLLTFSMDEDGGEEEEGKKEKKSHKDTPTRAHIRPKAADLFN